MYAKPYRGSLNQDKVRFEQGYDYAREVVIASGIKFAEDLQQSYVANDKGLNPYWVMGFRAYVTSYPRKDK